ncbi:MAG: hypothetical protein EOS20_17505 [Mesorhizobium sp.]|uniref:hypothetical protein n=1 Tax=Mesorhizobium sp. TaxID=1871066 RepID=UPI000FEA6490|nr:hypothetical protein [Mesorhizobium sp.]RWQ35867.1 MAG: hypothetical protein EOS20_17505 [Mesorhizobium sp.]
MNSQKDAERIRAEMSIAQAIYDAICEMNGSSYRQDKAPLRWDTSSGQPLSLMSIDGFFELRELARRIASKIETPSLISLKSHTAQPPKKIDIN